METSAPEISVVVPVYNEERTLAELFSRLKAVLEGLNRPFEVIAVDDGSADRSLAVLKDLRAGDKRLRVIRLTRNFGQSPALYAGFSVARGKFIFMIDADLQNYPEDLPLLLEKLEEGYDVVSGWRLNRQDSLFRRLASRLLNGYIARVTRVPLHDYGCSLKGFRREVIDRMAMLSHRCRYLPVDVASLGGAVAEVRVRHNPRTEGESKYGLFKLVRTSFDLITSISSGPLQFFGALGWLFALTGFGMALRVGYVRMAHGDVLQLESVIAIFFFLAGVQMVATGMMCEYVSRIYTEVQRKPLFIIREEME